MLRAVPAITFAPCLMSASVEILEFSLRDLLQLLLGYSTHLFRLRASRPLRDLCSLLEEHCSGRTLDDEFERPVAENRNHRGDDRTVQFARAIIKLLDKLPDIYAMRTESSPDRRGRSRLPTRNLHFDFSNNLLGHSSIFHCSRRNGSECGRATRRGARRDASIPKNTMNRLLNRRRKATLLIRVFPPANARVPLPWNVRRSRS